MRILALLHILACDWPGVDHLADNFGELSFIHFGNRREFRFVALAHGYHCSTPSLRRGYPIMRLNL